MGNLSSIIYNTLGLNRRLFIFRVYGLAVVWALTVIFMSYLFSSDTVEVIPTPSSEEILAVLFFFLIDAPITETLMFQFFIQGVLRRATGSPYFSIIGSAIMFSLVHLENSIINAAAVIALGFALALTYEYVRMRVGNICAIIVVCLAHIFWNVFALLGNPSLFSIWGLQ